MKSSVTGIFFVLLAQAISSYELGRNFAKSSKEVEKKTTGNYSKASKSKGSRYLESKMSMTFVGYDNNANEKLYHQALELSTPSIVLQPKTSNELVELDDFISDNGILSMYSTSFTPKGDKGGSSSIAKEPQSGKGQTVLTADISTASLSMQYYNISPKMKKDKLKNTSIQDKDSEEMRSHLNSEEVESTAVYFSSSVSKDGSPLFHAHEQNGVVSQTRGSYNPVLIIASWISVQRLIFLL